MKNEVFFDLEGSNYPKSWNELSAEQLKKVATILDQGGSKAVMAGDLLAVLLNLTKKDHLFVALAEAEQAVAFLFDEVDLTQNKLPQLRGKYRKCLYGPADRLKNVNFDEFIAADTAFMRYMEAGKPADLDKLVTLLYRPKQKGLKPTDLAFSGDIRAPFNSHIISHRQAELGKLTKAEKLCVLYFFAGCKAYFAKLFPNLFKKGKGNKGLTWLHTLDAFTDHITQYNEVLAMPVNTVFFSMDNAKKEVERQLATLNALP